MRPLHAAGSFVFTVLSALGCGAKIDNGTSALGTEHGTDATVKDASPIVEIGLATETGATDASGVADTSGDATAADATIEPIGPCNPSGRGPSTGGAFVSMNWLADECKPDTSCIQVVHADGCHLSVQDKGTVYEHDMSAGDCALLGGWMTSSELISAVKRDFTCKYIGFVDVIDVQDTDAMTAYKVPSNCSDQAWVDHRACMQYLIDVYGR